MRHIITFTFFVLSVTFAFSQDTTTARKLYKEAYQIIEKGNVEKALKMYQEVYKIAEEADYYTLQKDVLFEITYANILLAQTPKAIEATEKLNQLAIVEKDDKIIRHSYLNLAHLHIKSENYEEGHKYIDTAIEIAKKDKNKRYLNQGYMMRGVIYLQLEDYEKGLENALFSLKLSEEIKDTSNIITNLRGIGIFLRKQGRLKQSLKYLLQGEEVLKQLDYPISDTYVHYNELANTYQQLENYNKAYEYFVKSLKLGKERGDKITQVAILVNTAQVQMNRGFNESALDYLDEAEPIILQTNHQETYSKFLVLKSRVLLNLGEKRKALSYGKQSRMIADSAQTLEQAIQAEQLLSDIYTEMNDSKKALEHFKNYKVLEDSLENKNNQKVLNELQVQYETEKKENEILTKNAEIEKLNQKRAVTSLLLIGSILLGLLGFLYMRWRNAQKERLAQVQFSQQLIQGQETERKRIARELHDSIGHALLLIKNKFNLNQTNFVSVNSMIDNTIEEIRSLSRDLHPHQLETNGLTNALEALVEKIGTTTEIFTSSNIESVNDIWQPTQEIAIYRIVQEAFNNIIKHSEASAANLTIKKNENSVQFIVQDNGKGFDYNQKLKSLNSLGLKTLQERINFLKGELFFNHADIKGTKLVFRVPL